MNERVLSGKFKKVYNKDDVRATLRLEEWLRSDELNKN